MNLALSNFAWDNVEIQNILPILKKKGFDYLELVLTKHKNWNELNEEEIINLKKKIEEFSLKPYSIQSLFFGITYQIDDPNKIIHHFKKLIDYSEILDSKVLVFGSPSLRKKSQGYESNLSIIFKEVDEYLTNKNIKVVIEPNTSLYGGEFFITISEIVNFIEKNNLVNIKTMIDTHNLILEGENPLINLDKYYNYIYHIHVSEPNLKIIEDTQFHRFFSEKLREKKYEKVITYEVNRSEKLLDSLNLFCDIYG